MSTKCNFTSISSNLNTEYVRKGKTGLELVRVKDGIETVGPVQTRVKSDKKRLTVGLEARSILVHNCGEFHGAVEVI
jgi:hypothetical protein